MTPMTPMTTKVPRVRRTEASRRRSAREWRALVRTQSRGDETRTQFCARHGVALSTFDWWRRRLRTESDAPAAPRVLPAVSGGATPLFVELAPHATPAPMAATAPSWEIELDLGAGVVLRLRRDPC